MVIYPPGYEHGWKNLKASSLGESEARTPVPTKPITARPFGLYLAFGSRNNHSSIFLAKFSSPLGEGEKSNENNQF